MLPNRIIYRVYQRETACIAHRYLKRFTKRLQCNSLICVPVTEKRRDLVQRGVNKEMPPYSYKNARKRKPPDKISFIIRGLG